jgi:hypothetical protein
LAKSWWGILIARLAWLEVEEPFLMLFFDDRLDRTGGHALCKSRHGKSKYESENNVAKFGHGVSES